ncbi:MAG TPA: TetR/AcrR family transcriptional regulator [Polyangiaceae bacterium]|jgi:AcrR family transcriptional regulator|nr:TetR/AcrR family transcriptional regulator [Polyangiaceae bacterium]
MDATLVELGRTGYMGLRIERVASAARVHKTSLYRRWPTKEALVGAALVRESTQMKIHDTGDLIQDLVATIFDLTTQTLATRARGALRMIQSESGNEEVDRILRDLRSHHLMRRRQVVDRAIERGDLPPGTPATLLSDLLFRPVIFKTVSAGEEVEESYVRALVEIVVAGARAIAVERAADAE